MRYGRVVLRKGFPVEGACIIGASHFAIAAADALAIIHHHDAIRPVVAGANHANFYTGSVFAVLKMHCPKSARQYSGATWEVWAP